MAGADTSSARGASPLDHTRQVLDELDALMERMMALPVNDLDNAAIIHPDFRVPTVSATVTILDTPPPTADSDPAPPRLDAEHQPSIAPPHDSSAYSQPPVATGYYATSPSAGFEKANVDPAHGLLPDELLPSSVLAMTTPAVDVLPTPPRGIIQVFRKPLFWTNSGFDWCVSLLGPGGRWLHRPSGRNFLGVSGLAFIGLALAWLIKDWLGWTW